MLHAIANIRLKLEVHPLQCIPRLIGMLMLEAQGIGQRYIRRTEFNAFWSYGPLRTGVAHALT